MKDLLFYFLQVTIASGILYSYYHWVLRNKKFHRYNRFYLLSIPVISIVIPFLNIPVYYSPSETGPSFVFETLSAILFTGTEEATTVVARDTFTGSNWFTWSNLFSLLYVLIAFIILLRIILSLLKIRQIIKQHSVEQVDNIHFVNTEEPNAPFSFFRWLFWNKKIELRSTKGEQVFRHEFFHIEQKHSWDIIYLELVSTLFWLNPFFHLVKRETKAIHEFLADQFAIHENKKWEYAELLLMQAFHTRQRLVNPFFHNQIKRRIAMITTSQKSSYQYLRKLMVLPIAALAAILFAFNYKDKKNGKKTTGPDKTITVVIDAGHGGKDGGAIAADGTLEKDIVLAIAKKIKTLNEDENIKIILTREKDELPDLKNRTEFGNKQNPDLFLSIHVNSSTEKSKTGFEVVIPHKTKTWYSENKILASILFGYLNQTYPSDRFITENKNVWVLENSICPAALIECGYISNEKDLRFISNPGNQDKIAKSILASIDQYVMQQKSSDWQERKRIVADTVKPRIEFGTNPTTGKTEWTYNGEKIKRAILYKSSGRMVLEFEGDKMVLLSSEQSEELKKSYDGQLIIDEKINVTKPDEGKKIFEKVEIEPAFPGGEDKWKKYLDYALDVSVPFKNKAPKGDYTVVVQFIVNTEGYISDVRPLTKHGYGMEEEAMRILKKGPKWIPAIQNGRQVVAYKKVKVNFFTLKENKITSIDYSNPSNWNYDDPDFRLWRQNAITEIVRKAREEGLAAYTHKGRTYVFAKINNPDRKINTYVELDGTHHSFILNGKLITSIVDINDQYKRKDIVGLKFISKEEAKEKYGIEIPGDNITLIEATNTLT